MASRRSKAGIRELKARASAIVLEVREQETTYTITSRGEPVALLSPVPRSDKAAAAMHASPTASWVDFLTALDDVGRRWRSRKSGAQLLNEIRR